MCVRTLFQRTPRTGAGDPKQREQPARVAARRAGLTAWRSPRTSMPAVGIIQDSPRHLGRHVTQLAGRDGGRVGRGHQVGGRSASGPSVGSPTAGAISTAGQCGPMVPLPQRCSTQDAVGPSAAFAASPPPVPRPCCAEHVVPLLAGAGGNEASSGNGGAACISEAPSQLAWGLALPIEWPLYVKCSQKVPMVSLA